VVDDQPSSPSFPFPQLRCPFRFPLPIWPDNGCCNTGHRVISDPVTPGHSDRRIFCDFFCSFLFLGPPLPFFGACLAPLWGLAAVDSACGATFVTTTGSRGPVGSVRGNIPCEPRMGKLAFRSSPSIISVFDRQPQRRTLSAHRPRRRAPSSRTSPASLHLLSLPTATRIARILCC
jgi:hypothetical protein